MNHEEFQRCVRELGPHRALQASDTIEDALELQVQDSVLCLEWNEDAQRLEITLPLPELLGEDGPDALHLRLCRALLAWQWVEAAQPHHLRFGELGAHGQIVGLASVQPEHLRSPGHLDAALLQVHDGLRGAWLQLGAQVLAEAVDLAHHAPPRAGLGAA